jgi:hypothetical protein
LIQFIRSSHKAKFFFECKITFDFSIFLTYLEHILKNTQNSGDKNYLQLHDYFSNVLCMNKIISSSELNIKSVVNNINYKNNKHLEILVDKLDEA